MRANKIHKTKADTIVMWVVFVIFALYAISLLFPFLWCLMNSFKTRRDFFLNINGLPEVWTVENWVNSFSLSADRVSLPMMYFNSIFMTVGATFLSLMSCSATGVHRDEVRVSRQGRPLFDRGDHHDDSHHGFDGVHL